MRKDWDDYWFDIARSVSSRATCPRRQVGAVIVSNKRILATGYNGAKAGEAHCTDVGCDVKSNHCRRAVHAEINAMNQLLHQKHSNVIYFINDLGSNLVMYCTLEPCKKCAKEINTYFPNMEIKFLERNDNK